ncbi:MAG: hypothetical protein FJ395_16225 [Verrucomicrobia bacterium]|nr:hypothetical protein [Verrucomicrobiota bacterium]
MLTTTAVAAPTMDRYKVIVERSPFGKAETSGGVLSATASNFFARFAFVGVIKSPDGGEQLAVILDKAANVSHFRSPGETIGDVVVERIEETQPKRRLLLRRGIETGALVFGEGAPAASVPTMARPSPPMPPVPTPSGAPVPDAPVQRRRVPFIR